MFKTERLRIMFPFPSINVMDVPSQARCLPHATIPPPIPQISATPEHIVKNTPLHHVLVSIISIAVQS